MWSIYLRLVERMDLDAVPHVDVPLLHYSLVRMYADVSMVLLQAKVDWTASQPNAELYHLQEIMYTLSVLSPSILLMGLKVKPIWGCYIWLAGRSITRSRSESSAYFAGRCSTNSSSLWRLRRWEPMWKVRLSFCVDGDENWNLNRRYCGYVYGVLYGLECD
jgi:hypothetical protein